MGTLQLLSPGFKTLGFGFILKSYSKGTGFDCFLKLQILKTGFISKF